MIPRISPLLLFLLTTSRSLTLVSGFQNLLQQVSSSLENGLSTLMTTTGGSSLSPSLLQLEQDLLSAIANEGSRLGSSSNNDSDENTISTLITQLETQNPTPEPAISPLVYGRWRLAYTTNAGTSSPIQRSAVNAQKFAIYQDILLVDSAGKLAASATDPTKVLQVNQVVQFADNVLQLSVDALASTAAYPLPELTERQSGTTLGLSLLGVSLVGEEAQELAPNARIAFVFDEGNFDIFNGALSLPYPVPFRLPLLRDAVKGWIDISYLSPRLRIARGNKGTTFVLIKEEEEEGP